MGEGRKYDVPHHRSSLADRFELAYQRMGGIDFVVPVGADQEQVLHIRPGQQIIEQIERCRIEPLQVIKEQRERMFRPREYADESAEYELEATLRVLWRKLGDWWLFSDDELQFRDQIHDEQSVRIQCLTKRFTPSAQFGFALTQKRADKALKCLR